MGTMNENTFDAFTSRASPAYIDRSINPDDKNLLISLSERYTAMLVEYHKKYKKIRLRKILLDMIIFAISSGGIISSIAVAMPIIALVTGGGILATKLAEQLKYNKKLVILKKIIKELKFIIDEIEGYKRGNEYDREKFLSKMNYIDHLITTTSDG